MAGRFTLLSLFVVVIVVGAWVVQPRAAAHKLLSPFSQTQLPSTQVDEPKFYYVYGFAPFWNLQRTTIQPELTHFAYFSLPITEAGELDGITTTGRSVSKTRWESERLRNTAMKLRDDQEFAIVFTQFNNASIRKILASPSALHRYQESVAELLETSPYPITSVNIDIEYTGEASAELRGQYIEFVKRTRAVLDQQQKQKRIELSFCVYASAANKPWIWDIKALAPHVDHIVVMAYDFHHSSSPVAGPVAPVFGGKRYWDSDIITHLEEFIAIVPAEKLILGIPFYGYEWQTTSRDSRASVFPGTGSTASYTRVQEIIRERAEQNLQEHWDELALSPYLTFTKNNRSHVIYYEDERSLSYKLDLVRDLNMAGIAIWALGYENDAREPWDVIRQKLSPSQTTMIQ